MKGQKDYENAKIYKIVNDTNRIYIGSTCMPLNKRLYNHRRKKNCSSRELLNGSEEIILIHNYPCKNNNELRKEERRIYDLYKLEGKNVINYRLPFRTTDEKREQHTEWKKNNPEELKNHSKKYYKKHKEEIKERCKTYREKNREKNRIYAREYRKNKELNYLLNIDISIFR